jgi:Beige/BEACH domain
LTFPNANLYFFIFWLVEGKFDAPDRMFYSLSHCFNCVLSNHADVKELIPEFYDTKDYDFLINARGLQLGATQTGERVDDVVLPPWAKSPRDFLKKSRKALESEYCSQMLPKWIDLIFGCRSRGEAAKEADNLFHSCCYLGDNDLAAMKTEDERFQAELQATEFGLVPDQLFAREHPHKLQPNPASSPEEDPIVEEGLIAPEFCNARSLANSRDYDSTSGGKGEAWELLDPPSVNNSSHGEPSSLSNPPLSAFAPTRPGTALAPSDPVGPGGQNPFDPIHESASTLSRNPSLPLSGTGDRGYGPSGTTGRGAFSSLAGADNEPKNVEASRSYDSINSVSPRHHHPAETIKAPTEWDMKVIERRQIHGDAVSGCALVLEGEDKTQLLATTSLDGGMHVHTVSLEPSSAEDPSKRGFSGTLSRFSYISMSRGQAAPSAQSKLTEFRRHTARDPLACLVMTGDGAGGHVAFAGGHDDVVLAYGINSACAVASVYSHRDAVTGLDLIARLPTGTNSALWLEKATHIMVSGSWDATVKVWSVTVDKVSFC